ncbi:MAG: mandelate racemase/muconate lactonizing enzyme family protein [Cephaloticoccus sp.]|nr:mandelate racemase/muconate lactonizing enzyme family protein [Cephaloticoccus sp.]MCF7761176.1 mandelate racemase/muconate lactonizing enzyme family protein [Cephaloticoccus sp.]
MKITKIESFHLRQEDPGISLFDGSYDDCVIRITTDTGHSGIGEVESFPAAIQALLHAPDAHNHARGLAGVLLGRDPRDPGLWDELYNACDYVGRRGLTMHALGGLDLALWDLRGQVAGLPVHALLGGAKRKKLRAYGTIYPIKKTAAEVKLQVEQKLAELHLSAVKLVADPWWMDDIALTTSLLKAAREALGPDRGAIVDCALAYQTAAEGLSLYPAYREIGLLFLEAPLPLDDMPGHAEMAKHGIPLGVGDLGLTHVLEFIEAMDQGGASICQPDITMVGGFTGIQKIAAAARTRGKRVITHGYKTNITIAANLHFLAAHHDEELLEYSTSSSLLRWEMTNELLPVAPDGFVTVPDQPGLGVTLNEAALKKFTRSKLTSVL